ncbi:ROK family protein [Diaminobutyricibacter sp. McL0618]|uniref:ROK family protein n=1 Tax=Leifsonia sp. McL0618 TaxID=3415677 RepID=UPI003CF3B4DA
MSAELPPVVALDIGGTKLAVGVVDSSGAVYGMRVEPTRVAEGPDVTIERLFAMADKAMAEAAVDPSEIAAIGISCGGPMDSVAGLLLAPLHLPGWIDVPITSLASARFGVPAILANDATAGAWGEYRFGAGQGMESLVYLTVSTGMGGGAVLDGRLHQGAAGNGGEFGHIMVKPGGRLCTCGRHGCVEAYVAGSALADRAREMMADGRASILSTLPELTAIDVATYAATDALAHEIWSEGMELLGVAVTDLVNILEPDAVILGGGVTRSGSILLDPVRDKVLREAMGPAADAVQIVLAGLGDAVCVVGAGAIALDVLSGRLPAVTTDEVNFFA